MLRDSSIGKYLNQSLKAPFDIRVLKKRLLAMSDAVHFSTVEEAIADIALGKLVIVTDDENRENEGDLIMAASKVTPQTVNMMIR